MEHRAWAAADARQASYHRQGGLCALCWEHLGAETDGTWEGHHRLRRREMREPFTWCPCNIVALHARCHTQGPAAVHDHPQRAGELGLILPSGTDPRVAVIGDWRWMLPGPVLLDCDGMVVSTL
jgi:5-methylcytosine-specific restriction endonuclease McrA